MKSLSDPRTHLNDLCTELAEYAKLLRDYGTTPGNVWLARAELGKISQLCNQIEDTLQQIKREEEASG
jgi:hypothetical protein